MSVSPVRTRKPDRRPPLQLSRMPEGPGPAGQADVSRSPVAERKKDTGTSFTRRSASGGPHVWTSGRIVDCESPESRSRAWCHVATKHEDAQIGSSRPMVLCSNRPVKTGRPARSLPTDRRARPRSFAPRNAHHLASNMSARHPRRRGTPRRTPLRDPRARSPSGDPGPDAESSVREGRVILVANRPGKTPAPDRGISSGEGPARGPHGDTR